MKSGILLGSVVVLLAAFGAVSVAQADVAGLPASDVLGNEDLWENPTFVGGVINHGPTASSHY